MKKEHTVLSWLTHFKKMPVERQELKWTSVFSVVMIAKPFWTIFDDDTFCTLAPWCDKLQKNETVEPEGTQKDAETGTA